MCEWKCCSNMKYVHTFTKVLFCDYAYFTEWLTVSLYLIIIHANIVHHVMAEWLINWKGFGRKWEWPVLRYRFNILGTSMKNNAASWILGTIWAFAWEHRKIKHPCVKISSQQIRLVNRLRFPLHVYSCCIDDFNYTSNNDDQNYK